MTATQPERSARNRKATAIAPPSATDTPISGAVMNPPRPNKLELIGAILMQPTGATLDEMVVAIGWQPHSVRAGMTGLRKQGLVIDRSKADGVSRFRVATSPTAAVVKAAG